MATAIASGSSGVSSRSGQGRFWWQARFPQRTVSGRRAPVPPPKKRSPASIYSKLPTKASFGVSINDHAPETALKLVSSGNVDTVQVIYNIFDQSPEEELFALCQKKGVGVIARVPFDEGGLTGTITPETEFPERDWRRRYFRGERKRDVYERGLALQKLLGKEARSMPELAMRFCLHHEAVSTVIPGMRSVAHVEANCAVSDGRMLSSELIGELRTHRWKRNWY